MYKKYVFSSPYTSSLKKELISKLLTNEIASPKRVIDKPLVMYGAGNLGKMAAEYFDNIGYTLNSVVDKNARTLAAESFWKSRNETIYDPNEVKPTEKQRCLIVCAISNCPFSEIKEVLESQGWTDVVPFYDVVEAYRAQHPLSNGWYLEKFDEDTANEVSEIIEELGDDYSRLHYLQFIGWRRLRDDWVFTSAPINISNRYFIPEISLLIRRDERFLDIGAHRGETITRFYQTFPHVEGNALAIEADLVNFSKLKTELASLKPVSGANVQALPSLIAQTSGREKFISHLGYASQLSTSGEEQEATTLDALTYPATFVKIHLEGHELKALIGGGRYLRKHRPILAITAYHSIEGVYKLKKWIISNLDNYQVLLRNHGWCGTSVVVYAIPRERFERNN